MKRWAHVALHEYSESSAQPPHAVKQDRRLGMGMFFFLYPVGGSCGRRFFGVKIYIHTSSITQNFIIKHLKKKHHIHHIPTVFSPFDSFKPLKKQTTHKKWGRFSLSPQPLQMWKNRRLQRGEGCSSSGRCCDVHGRAVWRGQSSLTKCGQMWGSKSNVGMGICSQIPLVYLVGPFFTR